MDIETTLRQAIVAAKEGNKEEARYLLETVLDADERNEQAWLWMSDAVDSDEERIVCLENVLTVNPQNEAARRGLAALNSTAPDRRPFIAITVVLVLMLICTVMSILAFVIFSPM